MRRFTMCFMAAAALVFMLTAVSPGQAAINGTAHEVSVGDAGTCSACHIPHGAVGARLWPKSLTAGSKVGIVAQLCGSCHNSGEGYAANMSAAFSDNYVYGTASHGQLMRTNNLPWSTSPAAVVATLPYADCTANFECTTCHNVHDDTNRPFLRVSIDVICAYCHTNRHFKGGAAASGTSAGTAAGTWGTNVMGDNNVGSHPVGTDMTGDVTGGRSNIYIPTYMKVVDAGAGKWSLGGHLTALSATGGVTCVTCHAVHGLQKDSGDTTNSTWTGTTTAVPPVTNFLVVEQASVANSAWTNGSGSSARSVANGQGKTNVLCEACHGRTSAGALSPPPGYAGTYSVNPGGTSKYSHPIDDYPAKYDAGVVGFGSSANTNGASSPYWPTGDTALLATATNVNPIPICESCHAPHPYAEYAGTLKRTDIDNNAKAYILRAQRVNICAKCHSATIGRHHPTGKAYNSQGVTYLTAAGVTGASGDTLTCNTCHGVSGAHNWSGQGTLGITTGWKPADAGRNATLATYMYNADQSKTCMDCHYQMAGSTTAKSPTLGPNSTMVVNAYKNKATTNSNATHWIGLVKESSPDNTWFGGNYISWMDPTAGTWNTQVKSKLGASDNLAGNGYSRLGGSNTTGSRVIVCESCHSLLPGYNTGSHLLLAPFEDMSNGDDTNPATGVSDTNGRDILCEACHGVPAGTHQLTGQTVTRTGSALSISGGQAGGWLRTNITPNTNASWTVSGNKMSCDSCHMPHDANSNSYTFILDAPSADNSYVAVGTAQTGTNSRAAITGYANYYTDTLQGKGGSFTGFCNQCHLY